MSLVALTTRGTILRVLQAFPLNQKYSEACPISIRCSTFNKPLELCVACGRQSLREQRSRHPFAWGWPECRRYKMPFGNAQLCLMPPSTLGQGAGSALTPEFGKLLSWEILHTTEDIFSGELDPPPSGSLSSTQPASL